MNREEQIKMWEEAAKGKEQNKKGNKGNSYPKGINVNKPTEHNIPHKPTEHNIPHKPTEHNIPHKNQESK